jgi:hypothetical protein
MAGKLNRLQQLAQQKIATRDSDAEAITLKHELSIFFGTYGPDLLGGFLAFHREHIPLVVALQPLVHRSLSVIMSQAMAQAQPAKECCGAGCQCSKEEAPPDNIVKLPDTSELPQVKL